MRVLLVNDLPPDSGSGAENYLRRLAQGLADAGDDVALFAGEVVHTGAGKVLDLWDPFARRRLLALADRFRPDVVHHHNVVRELSASVLGVPTGTPTVLTAHDHRLVGDPDGRRRGVRAAVDRWVKSPIDRAVARRRVDLTYAVSPELAARLRAAGFRRVEHLPVLGTGPAHDPGDAGEQHDVVFAGRLTADKGADVLISAFTRIAAHHPRSRLVLAGDGPLRSRLEEVAAPIRDRVEWLGPVPPDDMGAVYRRARVVVVPSLPDIRPEGSSMVAVEAATHARPVIGSTDPAVAALVTRLEAGGVVPAGDVDALAGALETFLDDPARATAVGRRGRTRASADHDPDRVVDRVRAGYRSLLRSR